MITPTSPTGQIAERINFALGSTIATAKESLQAFGTWSTPDDSMRAAMSPLNLFAPAYHRKQSVKRARTIADLVRCEEIQSVQLAEAVQYQPKLIIG